MVIDDTYPTEHEGGKGPCGRQALHPGEVAILTPYSSYKDTSKLGNLCFAGSVFDFTLRLMSLKSTPSAPRKVQYGITQP